MQSRTAQVSERPPQHETPTQAQQTEKAIIRQGAEESSCKQVCCQIEDPARSHQAGQDSVRLSSDIEFQQLEPRAIQKHIAAMKILVVF
ncbi:hypothetical protein NDU88_003608 [Pleurodeles waltl]|uniref:Uncharacterized protein n=1 Tax=Pleurodeles waltl TaxID=8319 RepID=A0AAV7N0M2_PLEWA|nr:hypothetical protein NDU88_003608 [Pleurodeles waltl]